MTRAPAGAAAVDVSGLSWTPLGRHHPVLVDVTLRVSPGERVLLTGPSGSGKSTLLRALAGVLEGNDPGELRGRVLVDGSADPPPVGRVGLLVQDPADARVAGRVGRDVAFGPENAGVPREEIWRRVGEALEAVGFPYGIDHATSAVSGGEGQRLALAGVLALRPGLLLLDEPTSMLDEESAERVRSAVVAAAARTSTTLVVIEHQLTGWVDVCERLVVLGPGGVVVADGPTESILAGHGAELAARHGVWVPGEADPEPLEVPADLCGSIPSPPTPPRAWTRDAQLVTADDVGLRRRARRGLRVAARGGGDVSSTALEGISAAVRAGRVHAVTGPSGAGKSSLVGVLTGLVRPTAGAVRAEPPWAAGLSARPADWSSTDLARRLGWVPQRAESSVVGRTVAETLLATARALGRDDESSRRRAGRLLEVLGLSGRAGSNPHRLSGGELRRLALATAVLHGPPLLALDEPTVGQDRHTWAATSGVVLAARAAGAAVLTASHDPGFLAYADDRTPLVNGRMGPSGPVVPTEVPGRVVSRGRGDAVTRLPEGSRAAGDSGVDGSPRVSGVSRVDGGGRVAG